MNTSGSRRHIEGQVSFAEPDLDQVEKVATKNVPSDRIFTEADFQIEFAEIKVGKPNLMEPPVYRAPRDP